MSLYSFLWEFVWIGIFHIGDAGVVTTLLNWLVSMLLMLLIEPLLLSRFGTTPGKALFGLHVSAVSGGKLTWRRSGALDAGRHIQRTGIEYPLCQSLVRLEKLLPLPSGRSPALGGRHQLYHPGYKDMAGHCLYCAGIFDVCSARRSIAACRGAALLRGAIPGGLHRKCQPYSRPGRVW